MADKDINRLLMEYTEFAILTKHSTGYVSANLLLYYDPNDAKKRVAPDTFYVRKAERKLRSSYKLWEERFVPDVVFEFVAKASWRVDPEVKREIYQSLGVPEYYVFDPLHRWLDPPLWAYRLRRGRYVDAPAHNGECLSPRLGLRMRVEGDWLRFYDSTTGQRLLTADETRELAKHEGERAGQEAQRAQQEAQRAEHETRRADKEASRADKEAERVRALVAEVERLRQQLQQGGPPR